SAHAQQQGVSEVAPGHISSKALQLLQVRALFFHYAQPAKPIQFVVARPECGVALPQAGHLAVGVPILKRRLNPFAPRRWGLPARKVDGWFRAYGLFLLRSTASRRWVNGSSKEGVASVGNLAVIFLIEIAGFSKAGKGLAAAGTSASSVRRKTPCSRNASMV